jgi:hypothetical protein
MRIDWTSKFFSPYFTFYVAGQEMGKMDKNAFSTISEVHWNGDRYEFERASYFDSTYTLRDGDRNKLLTIKFQFLYRSATIHYNDRTFVWKMVNLFGSKWVLQSDNVTAAEGNSNFSSGAINFFKSEQLPIFLIFSAFLSYYYYITTATVFIFVVLFFIL